MANTKPPGVVELNARILASVLGCSVDEVEQALKHLCSPDARSRGQEEGGRRLVEIGPYLFEVPRWSHYRNLRNDDERRAYNRMAQARHREKVKASQGVTSMTVIEKSAPSAQAEAEAYTEAEASTSRKASPSSKPRDNTRGIEAPTQVKNDNASGPAVSAATWEAYSLAYHRRYGVEPVRNAKANALMHALVKRLGQEAVGVAGFYVTHNRALYVSARHAPELLVRDAEGLRTEWAGGRVTEAASPMLQGLRSLEEFKHGA